MLRFCINIHLQIEILNIMIIEMKKILQMLKSASSATDELIARFTLLRYISSTHTILQSKNIIFDLHNLLCRGEVNYEQ